MAAEGAGVGGEIGVPQPGCRNPTRIGELLMHADGAQHAVVDHDHDDRQIVLDGGGEFLPVHQETAVAGKGDDGALRVQALGRHGGRNAVPHRSRGRRKLGVELGEAIVAMGPDGIVAGAIGEDGVGRQRRPQMGHHFAHLQITRVGRRIAAPGAKGGVGRLRPGGPRDLVGRPEVFQRGGEAGR